MQTVRRSGIGLGLGGAGPKAQGSLPAEALQAADVAVGEAPGVRVLFVVADPEASGDPGNVALVTQRGRVVKDIR